MNELVKSLEGEKGIELSVFDEAFLSRIIMSRMAKKKFKSLREYQKFIGNNKDEIKELNILFNIHVSSFFRDPFVFSLLENVVIPEIIHKKHTANHREIRIWSAGCAAGQEAYSLAMIFHEKLENEESLKYRIFASDISGEILNQAASGIYKESDIRNVSFGRLNRWFKKIGQNFCIDNTLLGDVSFSIFNLLETSLKCPTDSLFGDFDIIFCSNVLLYYKPEIRKEILERINYCLSPNGYLIVDKSEYDFLRTNNYKAILPYAPIFQSDWNSI